MFYTYGVSTQGADHIRSGVVCQDSHKIMKCGENMVVAAVADGLGSEKYTDVASKLASDTAVSYCAANIKENDSRKDILDTIRASFMISQRLIEKTAEDEGHDIDQYDTTLSLVVVIDDAMYYGHSGDSGILAMSTDGAFYKVTEQQRDDMGRVFPLAFEDHWEFGEYEKPVVSVLLATDGMFEVFFPIYIKKERVNIHVPLARFFMDRDLLHFEEADESAVEARMYDFIKGIDPVQVSDDKTIVCAVNGTVECGKQPDEYYMEPDWDMLKKKFNEEWRKAAYPDLYKEDKKEEVIGDADERGAEQKIDDQHKVSRSDGRREDKSGESHGQKVRRTIGGQTLTDEQIKNLRARLSGGDLRNYPEWLRELLREDSDTGIDESNTATGDNKEGIGGSQVLLHKKL